MAFSEYVKRKAFERAGGHCENCNKELVYDNHEDGERGAWEAHHKVAVKEGGSDLLRNCQVLCRECHKKTASYGSHD